MTAVKIVWDGAVMESIMHGPDGLIGRWMYERGEIVKRAAVMQVNKKTFLLSRSILKRPVEATAGGLSMTIIAAQPYAAYIHEGTGIYGPKGQMIRPVHAKALHWIGAGGEDIFAKSVKGIKPNRFLSDNLKLFFA